MRVPVAAVCALFVICCAAAVMAAKDYYSILGVSRQASEADIKRSFRKLAAKYHPDKNPSPDAQKKYVDITKAYEVLSDKDKRRVYDQHGEEGLQQQAAQQSQGAGHGDIFGDIFSNFFGGHAQQRQEDHGPKKGPSLRIDLPVTLKDLYTGREFRILRDKPIAREGKGTRQCNCRQKMVTTQVAPGYYQQRAERVCDTCPAIDWVREDEVLFVDVEKGTPDNFEIVLDGESDGVEEGHPGDITLIVRTDPDPVFIRKGHDLHRKFEISLRDALLGFEHKMAHLDGHQVLIKRAAGDITPNGHVLKIAGEGMPRWDQAGNGDLYVEFVVKFPQSLSQEQTALIAKAFPV